MSHDLNLPPRSPAKLVDAASDADLDLPIKGFQGTPEEIERQWFEKIYTGRGDRQKQLTLRAVLMGGVLGMFMAVSNLYTTLKLGWAFGVAITACVLSFVIWNGIRWLSRGLLSQMTILETNCMQFYPEVSRPEAEVHPGLFRRRKGTVDLSTLRGPGFGYRVEEVRRELPPAAAVFGSA